MSKRKVIKLSYEEAHKEIDGILHKLCNRCWDWFPCNTDYFYKNKCSPDGLFPYCKTCNKKKSLEWWRENREYYEEVLMKRYHATDKYKETRKRIEARIKGTRRKWRQNNPDKLRDYGKNHRNHDITQKEWDACRLYFDYRCAYCGLTYEDHYEKEGTDLHKEHVIHTGRNDLKNCIPSCKSCNSHKWEFTLNEWYNPNNPRYLRERYLKIYQWMRYDCLKYIEKKKPKRKYKKKT